MCPPMCPPTAFSVPKINKKLEVWGRRRRRRWKSPSEDPCYCKGCMGKNKIASQQKTHAPRRFMYLRETKIWWCGEGDGEGGEGEKVHLLTHATARGMGKNLLKLRLWLNLPYPPPHPPPPQGHSLYDFHISYLPPSIEIKTFLREGYIFFFFSNYGGGAGRSKLLIWFLPTPLAVVWVFRLTFSPSHL